MVEAISTKTLNNADGKDPLASTRPEDMSRVIHGPREIQIYNEAIREIEEATRRKGDLTKAKPPTSSKLRSQRVIIPSVRWDDVDSLALSSSPPPSIRRRGGEVEMTLRNIDRQRSKSRPIQQRSIRTATRQSIREDRDLSILNEEDIRRGPGLSPPPPADFVIPAVEGPDRPPPELEVQEANNIHRGGSSTAPPTKSDLSFIFRGSSNRSKSRRVFNLGPMENQLFTQI
jgi:hypothetical protein